MKTTVAPERIGWIDFAKVVGIFLVVYGHTPIPEPLVDFNYCFHMPLFFFISGFLFRRDKFSSFWPFFRHRFNQLIIPYFLFNIITYLFWLLAGRHFGSDSGTQVSVWTPLLGMIYGSNAGDFLIHCGSLWFLPCLFVVEILYFLFQRVFPSFILIAVFLVLSYFNSLVKHPLLPWSIDAALAGVVFFASGQLFSDFYRRIGISSFWLLLICGLLGLLLFVLSSLFGRMDMGSNTYSNFPAFILMAYLGICTVFLLSEALERLAGKNKIVIFFSTGTLVILAFHEIAGSVCKAFTYFLLRLPLDIFQGNALLNLVFSLLSILLLTPVIWGLPKVFPFLSRSRKIASRSVNDDLV